MLLLAEDPGETIIQFQLSRKLSEVFPYIAHLRENACRPGYVIPKGWLVRSSDIIDVFIATRLARHSVLLIVVVFFVIVGVVSSLLSGLYFISLHLKNNL
jgi:hypothetical protein